MALAPTILETVVLAFAVSAACLTLTKSTFLEPVRDWIAVRNATLGELANCHFCMAHWVALAAAAVTIPYGISPYWWADRIVQWFALIGMASLISQAFIRLKR